MRLVSRIVASLAMALVSLTASAQFYTGMEGLIHVPTADMDSVLSARLGAHYMNKEFTPARFALDGKKYNTASIFMSVTPFKWIQLGYTQTLFRSHKNQNKSEKTGYYTKDRYFSLRIQPIRERKWWPSVVLGGNDVWGQSDGESQSFYFRNFYVALSKHYELYGNIIGAHVAYRHWKRDYNSKWNGPVGGLTFQPSFARELRLIGEYDGDGVNVGADYLLFRRVMVQAALHHGHYFNAGGCFYWDLDGMARKVKDKVKKKNESR